MRSMLSALTAVVFVASSALCQTIPPQITAVQKYIQEKDYPEVFGDAHYKTKIQNAVIADLDGDRQAEVIIHYMPHYRQSAPIVIYRVAPDLTVTRIKEGLAPGPLVPVSGAYLDSHTLGEAVDLDLAAQQSDAKVRRKFVEVTLAKGGGVVEYVNFIHMDNRAGTGSYIDMTGLAEPSNANKCEDFEFASVRQIGAGIVSTLGNENVLAAWAGTKVYFYRIKSFLALGLLDKKIWTVDVTADFHGFAPGAGGPLRYVTGSAEEKLFVVRCEGEHCTQVP